MQVGSGELPCEGGRQLLIACLKGEQAALDPAGYPYVSLDALYHKVRESGRVVSMATLIAIGISATGERSVLGVEVAAAGGDEGSRLHATYNV